MALVHVVVDTIGDAHDDGQAFYRALELLNAGLVSLGVSFDMRLRPLTIGDFPEYIPYMPTDWHDDGMLSARRRWHQATARCLREAPSGRSCLRPRGAVPLPRGQPFPARRSRKPQAPEQSCQNRPRGARALTAPTTTPVRSVTEVGATIGGVVIVWPPAASDALLPLLLRSLSAISSDV